MAFEDFTTYILENFYPADHEVTIPEPEWLGFKDLSNTVPTEFRCYKAFTIDLSETFWWESRMTRNGGGYAWAPHGQAMLIDALGWLTTAPIIPLALGVVGTSNCYGTRAIQYEAGVYTYGVQPPNGQYITFLWDPDQGPNGTLLVEVYSDEARTTLAGTGALEVSAAVRGMTAAYICAVQGMGEITASGSGGRWTIDLDLDAAPKPPIFIDADTMYAESSIITPSFTLGTAFIPFGPMEALGEVVTPALEFGPQSLGVDTLYAEAELERVMIFGPEEVTGSLRLQVEYTEDIENAHSTRVEILS